MAFDPTRYRPSLFRGVPFEALEWGGSYGRRLSVTEFPGRDEPWTTDLGRRARRYRLSAFVIGPLAPILKDQLILACEKPGPGVLIHPTQGMLTVRCEVCEQIESADSLNMIQFDLTFVEAGLAISFAVINSALAITKKAATYTAAKIYAIGRMSKDAASGSVLNAGASSLTDRTDTLEESAEYWPAGEEKTAYLDAMGEIADDVTDYFTDPESLADTCQGAFDELSTASDLYSIASTMISNWVETDASYKVSGQTATQAEITTNAVAIDELFSVSALAAAANLYASTDYDVYDDALADANKIAAIIDVAVQLSEDRDTVTALTDLRATTWAAMIEDAQSLPRLRDYVVTGGINTAMRIAQELYGDGERALEIVNRNDIAHPLFVLESDGALRVKTA